jgi:hypothetical protein
MMPAATVMGPDPRLDPAVGRMKQTVREIVPAAAELYR